MFTFLIGNGFVQGLYECVFVQEATVDCDDDRAVPGQETAQLLVEDAVDRARFLYDGFDIAGFPGWFRPRPARRDGWAGWSLGCGQGSRVGCIYPSL